ncbi:MAG: winged helix-turn-helix domain-containing protein [Caldilineaceae bacterium]
MPEVGPPYPLTYRQELVAPLLRRLQAGESAVVIGAASMGKSRLLQFLLRPDVRQHYWGKRAASALFVWVDCNRMAAISEWGLYELILTALTEAVGQQPLALNLRNDLNQLRKEALLAGNALLGQRYVELAAQMLCQEQGLHLCLILDEFDECYRILPGQTLANLRALRDANKYRVTYLLFMRDEPAQLRPPADCEGFYELLSRGVLGLKPHQPDDSRLILEGLVIRRKHELGELTAHDLDPLLCLSGGHPGLLVALVDAVIVTKPLGAAWQAWAEKQPSIQEECRKIWEGLRYEERRTLAYLAQGLSTGTQEQLPLLTKGLLRKADADQFTFFSPLFQAYVGQQPIVSPSKLELDAQAGTVWVDGRLCEALTDKEFKLLHYLNDHLGEICKVEQIIAHLYPGQEGYNINDNSIAALVKRVREKIEPAPKHPQYLLNLKGRGYRLVDEPE